MTDSIYYVTAAALLGFSHCANAFDEARAKNNLASDYATCAAYFELVSHAPSLSATLRNTYEQAAQQAFDAATALSGLDVTQARTDLAMKTMQRDVNNTWNNTDVLVRKHGAFCKDLMANPRERFQYWLDKRD